MLAYFFICKCFQAFTGTNSTIWAICIVLTTNAFKILEVIFCGFLTALEKKDNRSNSERQDSYDRTNVGNEGAGGLEIT